MSAIDFVARIRQDAGTISVREETWFEMSREVNALGLTRETSSSPVSSGKSS